MPKPKHPNSHKRKREFNRGYASLPPELLTPDLFPKLDARHMVILTFLTSFGLDAWPSIDSLAKATGFSRSKVRRALYELSYIGVLTTRHRSDGRGRQSSNLYQLGDGGSDGGFSDPNRLRHIKSCLANEKLRTTLNQLFGSGKKGDADPDLLERFRWCSETPVKTGLKATQNVRAGSPGVGTEAASTQIEPATEPTKERSGVYVSELELDPEYAKTTPFGEMKARVDSNYGFYKAFDRLHQADPKNIEQMLAFCREREMHHASDEIIVRAHQLRFTLFDLQREFEYAVAHTTGKPQALFLDRLRMGYRVNDKHDGFDLTDPIHAYAKDELETWLSQAGLEKQFKQARVTQLTPWMIAIVSVGHEPQDWLENFCEEFRVFPESAPPAVICAKLRDHFDEFARNQWVKTEAGDRVRLEAYLPSADFMARETSRDDLTDRDDSGLTLAESDEVALSAASPASCPPNSPPAGHNAAGMTRLREFQAKYLAEVGKTQAEVDTGRTAMDADSQEKSVA